MQAKFNIVPTSLMYVLALSTPAHAGLIVNYGTSNQNVDNVLYNACDSSVKSTNAQSIQGCLNTDHSLGVVFQEDTEAIKFNDAGGQASVESVDGNGIDYLKIFIPGRTFDKLDINFEFIDQGFSGLLDIADSDGNSILDLVLEQSNNQSKFVVTGGPFSFLEFLVHDQTWESGNGRNRTAESTDGTFVKQVRIGLVELCSNGDCGGNIPAPEPESMPMFLGGLAAVAGILRRRARDGSQGMKPFLGRVDMLSRYRAQNGTAGRSGSAGPKDITG